MSWQIWSRTEVLFSWEVHTWRDDNTATPCTFFLYICLFSFLPVHDLQHQYQCFRCHTVCALSCWLEKKILFVKISGTFFEPCQHAKEALGDGWIWQATGGASLFDIRHVVVVVVSSRCRLLTRKAIPVHLPTSLLEDAPTTTVQLLRVNPPLHLSPAIYSRLPLSWWDFIHTSGRNCPHIHVWHMAAHSSSTSTEGPFPRAQLDTLLFPALRVLTDGDPF